MMLIARRIIWIAAVLNRLYFRRIDIQGAPVSSCPTLFIASHRNGAVDGWVYIAALGRIPALLSVQLRRSCWLRLFFDGIVVVREKDQERYGIAPDAYPSPIYAAVEQIRAGGSLCLFPEGSSEWGEKPQDYQRGMAVIAAKLNALGVRYQVQPVGVFYSKPDGFRSRVSLVFGQAFTPPSHSAKQLQTLFSEKLNQVSVNCRDVAHFNAVQTAAWQAAQLGEDYGKAFLAAQTAPSLSEQHLPLAQKRRHWAKYLFALAFPLPVAAAWLAQRAAKGRNTVSFFRLIAAFYAGILQIALYVVGCYFAPLPALGLLSLGVLGFCAYPEPEPLPL